MPRVLLLLPTTSYRTDAFLDAAAQLGVEVTVASEQANTLGHLNPSALLTLDFSDPQASAQRTCEFARQYPIAAVVPVDSQVVVAGAAIATALGLPHNSIESALSAGDKYRARQCFQQARVPSPEFRLCSFAEDRAALAAQVPYPCVIKPLARAGSQGVMRADSPQQLVHRVDRLAAILESTDDISGIPRSSPGCPSSQKFLVERFVAGPEVALEGLLTGGDLQALALFDKPDPLDGPFFEETLYVTPSRMDETMQQRVTRCAQQAAAALGLSEGPVHAELRLSPQGPAVIEVNPRSIGGLCSRVLRFGTGMSLEELIIRHALREHPEWPSQQRQPAGVMMIPIPRAGQLRAIHGIEAARDVCGIEDLTISAHLGQQLVPLPEGAQYLGFAFARAESARAVETALRTAHRCLEFVIEPVASGSA